MINAHVRPTSLAAVRCRQFEYERSEPFRAQLSDEVAFGTAFCVEFPAVGKVILTNAHCVADAPPSGGLSLSFEHSGGPKAVRAAVKYICPELDFACLDCPEALADMAPMQAVLEPMQDVSQTGEPVRVLGFPLGDTSTVRTANGVWCGSSEFFAQFSASINGGNSGGPISWREGEHSGHAFAIATATIQGAEGVALGVPLYHVYAVLQHVAGDACLLRVPRFASLRVAPLSDVERCAKRARDGARVLQACGPLRRDDIIESVSSLLMTTDTAKLRIPHAFSGAELHSIEAALALLPGPARFKVHRRGVEHALVLRVPLVVEQPAPVLHPRWEEPGGLHYVMFGDSLCFVRKSPALLREFAQNMKDPFCVTAWAAPTSSIVLTWVNPGSEAERVGVEPLMLLRTIDGVVVDTCDKLVAHLEKRNGCKRKRRKSQGVALGFQAPHGNLSACADLVYHLSEADFKVYYYESRDCDCE